MNQRMERLKESICDRKHHAFRHTPEELGVAKLNETFSREGVDPLDRTVLMLEALLDIEHPVIIDGERIVMTRTISYIPDILTAAEWAEIKKDHFIHERGTVSNISPNYAYTIKVGFEQRKKEISERIARSGTDDKAKHYLGVMLRTINVVQDFISKYETHAREKGLNDVAQTLSNIKTQGAGSFREALQLLRTLHFVLWESGTYHNTLGRFDQYMYPYMKKDIEIGVLTREEAP